MDDMSMHNGSFAFIAAGPVDPKRAADLICLIIVHLAVDCEGFSLRGRFGMQPFLEAGVSYDAELGLDTVYATANFRFPLSPMRFTAGAFSNGNELTLTSRETGTIQIGGTVYPGDAVGTVRSVTSFASTAPYAGVGFDFEVLDKIGLNLDFGVLWQGDPEVTASADGILGSDPLFLAELEQERQELEAEMEDYKAWPVVSIGFTYEFL